MFLGGGYEIDSAGGAWFRGERPEKCSKCGASSGQGLLFHVHGWTGKRMVTLHRGDFVAVQLEKQRWKCTRCGTTTHSRPADDLPHVQACSLVVVLFLTAALVHGREKAYRALPETSIEVADVRTVGRWFRRALDVSVYTHQFLREAIIERCEPRPVEELFRSGLSPPDAVLRRTWTNRKATSRLWQSLTLTSTTSKDLQVPTAQLLARARETANEYSQPFLR